MICSHNTIFYISYTNINYRVKYFCKLEQCNLKIIFKSDKKTITEKYFAYKMVSNLIFINIFGMIGINKEYRCMSSKYNLQRKRGEKKKAENLQCL